MLSLSSVFLQLVDRLQSTFWEGDLKVLKAWIAATVFSHLINAAANVFDENSSPLFFFFFFFPIKRMNEPSKA